LYEKSKKRKRAAERKKSAKGKGKGREEVVDLDSDEPLSSQRKKSKSDRIVEKAGMLRREREEKKRLWRERLAKGKGERKD